MLCEENSAENLMIEQAQHGDRKAVEVILSKYRPLLFSLAGRMHVCHISPDELLQAGYLGMLQALSRFDGERGIRFITYAVPWILGEMKREIRKNSVGAAATSMQEVLGDDGTTLEETLSSCEDIDFSGIALRVALEQLSYEEQLLICLRYFRDKTQKETADLLKRSQTQISRIERRALEKLHEMMNG